VIYQLATEFYIKIFEFLKSSLLQLENSFDLNGTFVIPDPTIGDYRLSEELKPKEKKRKALFSGSEEERKSFKKYTCQLTNSVAQIRHHEEKHFVGTLKLIAKSFKKYVVMVDDSIQANTIIINS
jgi:hypothetical protein